MNSRSRSLVQFFRWMLWLALGGFAVFPAAAATVSATLSSADITAGESVDYELTVSGGRAEPSPAFPQIDGLNIRPSRTRTSIIQDFRGPLRQTIVYPFALTPQHAGTFEIPAIKMTVDGQEYSTPAFTLKVAAAREATTSKELAYGDLSVVRQPAYVGEDVIVEMRYYLELGTTRWGPGSMGKLEGEGFTSRGLVLTDDSTESIGGKNYNRLTFHAVVTPNRAGKIVLGPEIYEASVTEITQLGGARSGFQMSFANRTAYPVKAPAIEVEVKPLPAEGRPKDFAGAIGSFHFSGQGAPNHVKLGEPVTMALVVEGNGNFGRVGAPSMADPPGWRAYKATEKFEQADKLGVVGRKTFEVVVVPETKKTAMPVFNFSYFDPEKGKYVTLSSTPAPLEVEGVVAPPAGTEAAPADAKPKAVDDIVGIQPAPGFWGVGWQPRPTVWLALLLAPAPLIAFALFWRARRTDPRLAIRSALLRERSELLGRVRGAEDRAEVFDAAARVLQIDVAVVTGQPDAGIDEASILAQGDSAAVKKMYAARAELVYAGHRGGKITANERDEILEAIAEFERSRR